MQSIDKTRGTDHGAAMLIIMKDRVSITSLSCCFMMKHSGALISSRLMPPNVGPINFTLNSGGMRRPKLKRGFGFRGRAEICKVAPNQRGPE